MSGGISTGGKVTFYGGLDEHIDVLDLGLDGLAHLGVSLSGFLQLHNHLVEVSGQIANSSFVLSSTGGSGSQRFEKGRHSPGPWPPA